MHRCTDPEPKNRFFSMFTEQEEATHKTKTHVTWYKNPIPCGSCYVYGRRHSICTDCLEEFNSNVLFDKKTYEEIRKTRNSLYEKNEVKEPSNGTTLE